MRNKVFFSLILFVGGVKHGSILQGQKLTEIFPTQKLSTALNKKQGGYVRYLSETRTRETKVKVPKFILSVTNSVFLLNWVYYDYDECVKAGRDPALMTENVGIGFEQVIEIFMEWWLEFDMWEFS